MAFIKISRDEVIRGAADCIKKSSMLSTPHNQIGKNKWARRVEDVGKRSAYRVLVGKRDGKRPGRGSRCRWESNIKMNLHEIYGGVDWIDLLRIGACGRFLCRR
jgi:hypothetical protein